MATTQPPNTERESVSISNGGVYGRYYEDERTEPPSLKVETEWVMWKSENTPTSCDACMERHGVIYDKDKLDVEPPLHPNCKCELIPIILCEDGTFVTEDGKSVSTTAPQTEKEPETISNGGVYADTRERKPFIGGTPFAVKATLEAALAAANGFINQFWSLTKRYSENKNLVFDGKTHIYDQNSGNAANIKMGIAPFGSNACGWVAAYNAFVSLGMDVKPADIVKFIETKNGLIADGAFGTNPLVFDRLFKKNGVKSTTTLFEDAIHIVPSGEVLDAHLDLLPKASQVDLDSLAQQGQTIILTYYNNKDDISSGAHYINVTWDENTKRYTAYNTGKKDSNGNGIEEPFNTISDYLGKKRGLISMTVIN